MIVVQNEKIFYLPLADRHNSQKTKKNNNEKSFKFWDNFWTSWENRAIINKEKNENLLIFI